MVYNIKYEKQLILFNAYLWEEVLVSIDSMVREIGQKRGNASEGTAPQPERDERSVSASVSERWVSVVVNVLNVQWVRAPLQTILNGVLVPDFQLCSHQRL